MAVASLEEVEVVVNRVHPLVCTPPQVGNFPHLLGGANLASNLGSTGTTQGAQLESDPNPLGRLPHVGMCDCTHWVYCVYTHPTGARVRARLLTGPASQLHGERRGGGWIHASRQTPRLVLHTQQLFSLHCWSCASTSPVCAGCPSASVSRAL